MHKWNVQFDFALTVEDVLSMPNKVEDDCDADGRAEDKLDDPRYVKRLVRKAVKFLRETPPEELAHYISCGYVERMD